jgi:hypothetical protein
MHDAFLDPEYKEEELSSVESYCWVLSHPECEALLYALLQQTTE